MTYRQTLEGLLDRARKPDKRAAYEAELAVPEFPEALAYLWSLFLRLRRRTGGGFGGPIAWADVDAFCRLSGIRLAPWELRLVEELDDLYLSTEASPTDNQQQRS